METQSPLQIKSAFSGKLVPPLGTHTTTQKCALPALENPHSLSENVPASKIASSNLLDPLPLPSADRSGIGTLKQALFCNSH